MTVKRYRLIVGLFLITMLACRIGGTGNTGTGTETPSSSPGQAKEEDNVLHFITVDGQEVQVEKPTPDFLDVLLERIDSDETTLQAAVIANLKIMVGEAEVDTFYQDAEIEFDHGWGLIALAIEAYQTSTDEADKAEIERLLSIASPTRENLDIYAEPYTGTSWQPPQFVAINLRHPQPSLDCRAIAAEGFPADASDPPICLLYQQFSAGGSTLRIYFPREKSTDTAFMQYVNAAGDALRDSQARLSPYSEVGDIDVVFTLLQTERGAGIVAGVPGLVASATRPEACPVSVFPRMFNYNLNDFKQILAHEVFHCVSFQRKGTTGYRNSFWYQEGMAEHFSNVVYPDNNLELRTRLTAFDARSPETWLMGMSYQNFLFFQYLENRFGDDYIFSLHDALPTGGSKSAQASALADFDDMQTIFHEFGEAYLNQEITDSSGETIRNTVYYPPENDFEVGEGDDLYLFAETFTLARYRIQFDDGVEYTILKEESGEEGKSTWRQDDEHIFREIPPNLHTSCEEPENYITLVTSAPPGAVEGGQTDIDMSIDTAVDGRMDCCLVGTWQQDTDEILSHILTTLPSDAHVIDFSGTFHLVITDDRTMYFAPADYHGTIQFSDDEPVTVSVSGASIGTFVIPDDEEGVIRSTGEDASFIVTTSSAGGTYSYPLEFSGPFAGADSFRYTCTATTLTSYTGDVAPFTTSSYTRVSDTPQTPEPPVDLPAPPSAPDEPPDIGGLPPSCSAISFSDFSTGDGEVSWMLSNDGSESAEIKSVYLDWPGANGAWENITLNDVILWNDSQSTTPGLVESGWEDRVEARTLAPSSSNHLSFAFANPDVASTGYIAVIEFTDGCFASDVR